MGDSSPKRYNENLCDSEGRFPIGFLFSNAFFQNVLQRRVAKHQRASNIQHWNMLRAFTGPEAF